jgi:hypothetical protein
MMLLLESSCSMSHRSRNANMFILKSPLSRLRSWISCLIPASYLEYYCDADLGW